MTTSDQMNSVLILQELLTPKESEPAKFGLIIKDGLIYLVQLSDETYFDFETVEECIAFLIGINHASQNK